MLLEIRTTNNTLMLVNPERCVIEDKGAKGTMIHDPIQNKCLYTEETYKQLKGRIKIPVSGCPSTFTK